MRKLIRCVGALLYLPRNIWYLKDMTKKRGIDSNIGMAYRIRMRLYGSWIDPYAFFLGIPCFPHGIAGIFIGGGVNHW